ncbi:MAG TPA: LysR family transcriptional regulator [Solirubrobacterales bacterium]|jgi:DNA-binding transcriptional LysR family regulator|nr:LysR family transcriptional regulator [Solirubrobacterales bacterium]
MLDVKRMRVLREVIAMGSFSAAADSLHLSQSAVSQQVAALEREVGMKLLERTSDGPKLTKAGETLMDHADAVLSRLAEAERELSAIAGLEGGRVRVISFPSASATLLTRAVSLFRSRFPAIELELGEGEPEDSVPAIRAGDYDVALSFDFSAHPVEPGRDLERALLLEERMWVALPPGHPLAGGDAVRLEDLADDDWMCGRSGSCREHVIRLCREAGYEPQVSFDSDDYQVLKGLVAAGLGVTLLPELALAERPTGLELRPIAGRAATRRVWAVTREASTRSPATQAMVGVLVEAGERYTTQVAEAIAA